MVTVWVTVLVSVLGETVTVLGGTVVVAVSVPLSVLGGGAVSVTVSVGAPPPPWWRGGAAAVVVTAVVGAGAVVVVVLGAGAGEPATSVTTAVCRETEHYHPDCTGRDHRRRPAVPRRRGLGRLGRLGRGIVITAVCGLGRLGVVIGVLGVGRHEGRC